MIFLVLLVVFSFSCVIQDVSGSAAEAKLIAHLFNDRFDRRVRPAKSANKPLHLHVENVHLKRLTNINEDYGTVNIGLWVGLAWNDSSLSWSPSSYNEIKLITVRANQVWTPDVHLYSGWGVTEHSFRDSEDHDVLLHSSGLVMYYPSVKLDLPCLNRTSDTTLECNFALACNLMNTDMIDLHLVSSVMDTSKYVIDPNYHLTGDSIEKMSIKVDQAESSFAGWTWELVVARMKLAKK